MADQNLSFRLSAQVSGQAALDKFKTSMDGIGRNTGSISSGLKTLTSGFKLLGAAFAVREAVQFGQSLLNLGDELNKLSQKTGVSVKDLSGFKDAAALADVPIEFLGASLRKLAVNMVAAGTGSKEAQSAFASVGVAFKDSTGQIRPTGDVLKDIAEKFKGLKDGPEKAALAVKLFGKSGSELIPLLNGGRESLSQFGQALDDDFAARAEALNDTFTRIGFQFRDGALAAFKELMPTLQEIGSAFEAFDAGEDSTSIMQGLAEATRIAAVVLVGFGEAVLNGADAVITLGRSITLGLINAFVSLGDIIKSRAQQLKAFVTGDFAEAMNIGDQLAIRQEAREKTRIEMNDQLLEAFAQRSRKRTEATLQFGKRLLGEESGSILFGKGQERAKENTRPEETKNIRTQTADIEKLSKARGEERDRVKEFIEQQKLENTQRREALGDLNFTVVELAKVKEMRKLDAEAIRYSRTMTAEQRVELMKATEEIKKQRAEIIDLEQAQQRSFQGGLKRGLREYADEATNVGKQVEEATRRSFDSMADSLTDFVTTGKFSFKDFANAIIKDMIRIAIQSTITGPLAGALGKGIGSIFSGATVTASAMGNVMTGDGPVALRKYARGGIASSPQISLFGEGSRPEAYVPLPDGRTIPVTVNGGSGGVSVVTNINLTTGEQDQESSTESGKALGNLISMSVKNILIQEQRPGGLLAQRRA